MSIFDTLRYLGCVVEPCGSRVTVSPPPTNTDEDYLVEVPWSIFGYSKWRVSRVLLNAGFYKEGPMEYRGGVFKSYRRGPENLIVTDDHEFALRHRAATHVCKSLNLKQKPDRVRVFQAVLYGAKA